MEIKEKLEKSLKKKKVGKEKEKEILRVLWGWGCFKGERGSGGAGQNGSVQSHGRWDRSPAWKRVEISETDMKILFYSR